MAIDVDVKGSPGELMQRLARKLEGRRPRLQELHDRYRGDPPLPEGYESVRKAYRRLQKKARTNFAELIVESTRDRMKPTGFRTAVDADENGDAEAKRIADASGLWVEWADVAEDMLSMGDGYMLVGADAAGAPVITGEDPRQVVTAHDPVQQRRVRAGLKLFHDEDQGRDLAYLYKLGSPLKDGTPAPAEVHVAYREVRRQRHRRAAGFAARQFTWDDELTKQLPHTKVPLVRFRNRRGVGEFELHVDILDRINHMILSRLVIAAMQAYRQRAVKNAPTYDAHGVAIDYDAIFEADPGAIWTLPPAQLGQAAIEMWESGVVDLTPILTSVKDDIRDLAAVTRTALPTLAPEANQAAEGATFQREGQVFKVEDRITRASEAMRDVMELAFLTAGDVERADRSKIEVLWLPPERRSLAEMADAESKTKDSIPFRTRMSLVWGMTPDQIDRMEAERAADLMATAAAVQQAPAGGG